MAGKSKVEELTNLLKDLEATTPDIEASAVVSCRRRESGCHVCCHVVTRRANSKRVSSR